MSSNDEPIAKVQPPSETEVSEKSCPCGSGARLEACCGPILSGRRAAPTAEMLMRSRFSAYCLKNANHLLASWAPSTRPSRISFAPDLVWTHLEIRSTSDGNLLAHAGTVEFVASFHQAGEPSSIHELSTFARHDGQWVYVDGVHNPDTLT